MPDPSPYEVTSAALTRLANARRRRVTEYANLAPRPGESQTPARLLSDIGFLSGAPFSYVNAHQAHTEPPEDDAPRVITHIVFVPYGVNRDRARLTSRARRNRLIGTTRGILTTPGVATLFGTDDYVAPAYIDDLSFTQDKTDEAVRSMVNRLPGPAFHALVDRGGGVIIGPALDFKTSAVPSLASTAIFIGLEGALAMGRTNFNANFAGGIFELPYTSPQLTSLAVLVAKLLTAFPSIPRTFSAGAPGFNAIGTTLNFTSGRWVSSGTSSPFRYETTDDANFFALVDRQGGFNLATEVFQPRTARPSAARREVQTAIGQVDTTGARALLLGAYVDVAAPERAFEMLQHDRQRVFVRRTQVSHVDADEAGEGAAHVTAGEVMLRVQPKVTNVNAHVYNYTSGLWGDGVLF